MISDGASGRPKSDAKLAASASARNTARSPGNTAVSLPALATATVRVPPAGPGTSTRRESGRLKATIARVRARISGPRSDTRRLAL
jgi:hypothetical protein